MLFACILFVTSQSQEFSKSGARCVAAAVITCDLSSVLFDVSVLCVMVDVIPVFKHCNLPSTFCMKLYIVIYATNTVAILCDHISPHLRSLKKQLHLRTYYSARLILVHM